MRVLVCLRHTSFAAHFESMLVELVERGHHVDLRIERRRRKWAHQFAPVERLAARYPGLVTSDELPRSSATAVWTYSSRRLRAWVDWLRYLEPAFADASKLRARAAADVPLPVRTLARAPGLRSRGGRRTLRRVLSGLERRLPVPPAVLACLERERPDLVVVTHMLDGRAQTDYVRACARLGIPSAYVVASWDNLTSKGLIHELPTVVTVWNEHQLREAVDLHDVPADRVAITGAHPFDRWFGWSPSATREEFCSRVGLDPARPFVLYVGSSRFIAPAEGAAIERWLDAVRDHGLDAGVLVRPHPSNPLYAGGACGGLYERADAVVWPREGTYPGDADARRDYYDSIHHAAAVVGINSSALVESAIVGREVFTLASPEFEDTQAGTPHFHLIADPESGVLNVAATPAEHVAQLSRALAGPREPSERVRRFVASFVRPLGMDDAAAAHAVDALEAAARAAPEPVPAPGGRRVAQALVFPVAAPGAALERTRRAWAAMAVRARHGAGKTPSRPSPGKAGDRPSPAAGGMRVAFALHYPGYLRYFDSTIALLEQRGHAVELYFDQLDRQAEGLEALASMGDRVRVGGVLARRRDPWRHLLADLRYLTDFLRYLDPAFSDAGYLRDRAAAGPRFLRERMRTLPRPLARALVATSLACERAVPRGPAIDAFLAELLPDVLVVSPYVQVRSRQRDLVRSARALGIPTVVAVASWDHLTTKGIARPGPDRYLVWNETQRDEAVRLHRIPPSRVVVTGAQPFDKWFGREPSRSREELAREAGLPHDRPFALFVGSTPSISAPDAERRFVRAWLEALRSSADPAVRELGALVRPHPYNSSGWEDVDLSDLGGVVWPRSGANPVAAGDRADYFDTLAHAAVVVGVNTSAMIEAAIAGRPVLTVEAPEFRPTQGGTLHFRYLLPEAGGFVRAARSLEEHVDQLSAAIADPGAGAAEREAFVRRFVRPAGLDVPATPIAVEAIETAPLAAMPAGDPVGLHHLVLRALLWPPMRAAARRADRDRQRRKAVGAGPGLAGTE